MKRRRRQRGQVSTIILVFIAVVLMLAMSTFNVGMVAITKTETANASDAAALAAASWIASSQNEVALGPAKAMWINYHIFLGFCLAMPFHEIQDFIKTNIVFMMMQAWRVKIANELLRSGWVQAHMAAVMTSLSAAGVDDPRKAVEAESFQAYIHSLEEKFKEIQKQEGDAEPRWPGVAEPLEFTWDRQPDDQNRGEQTLKVQIEFDQPQPKFSASPWGPPALLWMPPKGCPAGLVPPCPTVPGWVFGEVSKQMKFLKGPVKFFLPRPRLKQKAFILPLIMIAYGAKPKDIENGDGKVTVTVTRTIQDADLRLWQMKYPEKIESVSVAKYNKAIVNERSPRDRSSPSLERVQ